MKTLLITCILILSASLLEAQNIYTVAGDGTATYCCDGGQASAAGLNYPEGVSVDLSGNLYIADYGNNLIREVDTKGVISSIAGDGTIGFCCDGGQATAAKLDQPSAIAWDIFGNIYIADTHNNRIRKVTKAGVISTFAGSGATGIGGYSGDGGPATAAELYWPYGVATDIAGNVYIADYENNRIRKVNTSGIISTIAGNGFTGYLGDGGQATAAEFDGPNDVTLDPLGNIYIADSYNNCIRKIDTSGIITTIAGNGTHGYSGDGGAATAAELYYPSSLVAGDSGVYIADSYNNRIRRVNPFGIISTLAGNGTAGYSGDGGAATAAELNQSSGVGIDVSGNIYIADYINSRVREVTTGSALAVAEISDNMDIRVYPNPGDGQFNIQIPINEYTVFNIEIYNVLGEKIYSTFSVAQFPISIDISSFSNGIYILQVVTDKGIISKKIEVAK